MSEGRARNHPEPFVIPLVTVAEGQAGPAVRTQPNRFARRTLGHLDLVVEADGVVEGVQPTALLVLPVDRGALRGLDRASVRLFRVGGGDEVQVVWNSGINLAHGFVWAKLRRPGTYMPIGLPRDRLLHQLLLALAHERRLHGIDDPELATELTKRFLGSLADLDDDAIDGLREILTRHEIATAQALDITEYRFGPGGHPLPFDLPRGESREQLVEQVAALEVPAGGLPEEALLFPLEPPSSLEVPWSSTGASRFDELGFELQPLLGRLEDLDVAELIPWLQSRDWPMYQHDVVHSGRASGSQINSATVGGLIERFTVAVDGPINTKPSIVDERAYVGTSRYPSTSSSGGTLYKINVCSGAIEGRFPTPADAAYYSIAGIGGSPAVTDRRVYFTTVDGKVWCVDATTMTASPPHPPEVWMTDLKNRTKDPVHAQNQNQPIYNSAGDCWSSPLVVNNKVYVGSGEGETDAWGFIWCLDASTGRVIWVFCTNKFQAINAPGNDNQPNVIPRSAAISDPLPTWATAAGFSLADDPQEDGSSPWSSFAYDHVLDRVYVGTGNSAYTPKPNPPYEPESTVQPDELYGSGLICLDADTGQFKAFHQAEPDDGYHPNDADIDVPGAPTIFRRRHGERVVCYGSKNGSFFLLDPETLEVLGGGAQRRQLLARANGTGHPGNRGTPIAGVATSGTSAEENKWGVMATPAVHRGLGIIYVGLGGYAGAGDGAKTPFIRALDWENLNDAWPTSPPDPAGVVRYSAATPPVYLNVNEAALSSPAVVHDVVFVSTTDPASSEMSLYALDAATGVCLWAAPTVPGGGWPQYALGPAISGKYVVQGAGGAVHVYTRPNTPICHPPKP
jgi:outer membrane protein assembly factor BamB